MTIISGRSPRPEPAARSRRGAATALALTAILAACGHSKAASVDTTATLVLPTTSAPPSAAPTTSAASTTAITAGGTAAGTASGAPTTTVAPTATPASTAGAATAAAEVVAMPAIPAGVAPTKDEAMAIAKAMLAEFERRYNAASVAADVAAVDALKGLMTERSVNRKLADDFFAAQAARSEHLGPGPSGYIAKFVVDELLGVDSLLIAVTECSRNEGIAVGPDGSVTDDNVGWDRGRFVLLRDGGGPWLLDQYTTDLRQASPDQPFDNCKDVLP
jgi:hypothetical protein